MLDLVAVAVPAVSGLGFGRLMLGRFRFPTGWDAMNHAILTGNILQTGSTAISDACSTGSTLRGGRLQLLPDRRRRLLGPGRRTSPVARSAWR